MTTITRTKEIEKMTTFDTGIKRSKANSYYYSGCLWKTIQRFPRRQANSSIKHTLQSVRTKWFSLRGLR